MIFRRISRDMSLLPVQQTMLKWAQDQWAGRKSAIKMCVGNIWRERTCEKRKGEQKKNGLVRGVILPSIWLLPCRTDMGLYGCVCDSCKNRWNSRIRQSLQSRMPGPSRLADENSWAPRSRLEWYAYSARAKVDNGFETKRLPRRNGANVFHFLFSGGYNGDETFRTVLNKHARHVRTHSTCRRDAEIRKWLDQAMCGDMCSKVLFA